MMPNKLILLILVSALMMMSTSIECRKVRWGILSAGRISWDFIKSMQPMDKKEHEIVAIASRDRARGQKYADTFGIKKVYDRYEDLAKDPEIDAVYVATINPLHYAAVKLMLDHKKPVLCEKPLVIKPEDGRELFEYAKKQNTFMMEALWSRFIPSFEKVIELIEAGEIGEVEAIQANFILNMGDVKRLQSVKYGGGITLDIGIYAWHAVLAGVNFTRPTELKVTGRRKNAETPDRTVSATMKFPNQVVANFLITSHASKNAILPANHVLYIGRKGYIKLGAPINAPTQIEVNGRTIEMDFRDNQTDYNYSHSAGLRFQAEEVRKQLYKGQITSNKWTPEHTLMISDLNAEVLKQLNVKYPSTDRTYDFKQIE